MTTQWIKDLRLRIPVVLAPMAGLTKPEFVAKASNAGILGSLGAGMMAPSVIRDSIKEIKAATNKPFNINLFIIDNMAGHQISASEVSWIKRYYEKYNYKFDLPTSYAPDFKEQFQVLLDSPVPIASFTFGILTKEQVKALNDINTRVIGTATSLAEALAWEAVGADAVCLQGLEAGGHRGNFLDLENPGYDLEVLFNEVISKVKIPVIVTGGIVDGTAAAHYLNRGAELVQIGTAFLCTDEMNLAPVYKRAFKGEIGYDTRLTSHFSGRMARGLVNRFMTENHKEAHFAYPVQNALTQSMRKQAGTLGEIQDISIWSGTNVAKARHVPLNQLVDSLEKEIAAGQSAKL